MSTSTICLPAYILDAHITPRAREVLMLLASQTSATNPALWICQATIAERLRCSVATVARTIKQLIEAKLIADTGRLHEGKYKFYHVRWSSDENMKAVSKKIAKPVRKVEVAASTSKAATIDDIVIASRRRGNPGFQRNSQMHGLPRYARSDENTPSGWACNDEAPPSPLPAAVPPSTITPSAILKDSRIAYYAEIAKKRHEESRRLHQSVLLSLR